MDAHRHRRGKLLDWLAASALVAALGGVVGFVLLVINLMAWL